MILSSMLATWIVAGALTAAPQAGADPVADEPVVQLELLADTSHATPGSRFRLGARFVLPEEWHVYWTNPGFAGLPTKVTVTGPEGWDIGPPQFPGPERFETEGGEASYGYGEELVVFVPVRVPLGAKVGSTAKFELAASWLICKESCFRQRGAANLTLEIATRQGDTLPQPRHQATFERFAQLLPRPFAELGALERQWSGSAAEPELHLTLTGATALEFFPDATSGLRLVSRQTPTGDALHLQLGQPAERGEIPQPLRGLLRVHREERAARYYRVTFVQPTSD